MVEAVWIRYCELFGDSGINRLTGFFIEHADEEHNLVRLAKKVGIAIPTTYKAANKMIEKEYLTQRNYREVGLKRAGVEGRMRHISYRLNKENRDVKTLMEVFKLLQQENKVMLE